jgi:hypothetical protein
MARVTFRVPDDIKEEFDREFIGQNHGIIIALLMRAAVTEARRRRREDILRSLMQYRAIPARRAGRAAGRT